MRIIEVSGSHYERGLQVGSKLAPQILYCLWLERGWVPNDMTERTDSFWQSTKTEFPQIAEYITGVAKGVSKKGGSVSPEALHSYLIEEDTQVDHRGCTTIALLPPRTKKGVFLGFNNDLDPLIAREPVIGIEHTLENGKKVFTIGPGGFFVSFSANSDGIVVTGTNVTTAERHGKVPREVIAMAIAQASNLPQAIKIATHPNRASSYSYTIGTQRKAVILEATANTSAIIHPTEGVLVHANNLTDRRMRRLDRHLGYDSSERRLKRGKELAKRCDRITIEDLMEIMADHGELDKPTGSTICRHLKRKNDRSVTRYSVVTNSEEEAVYYAEGNPCKNNFRKIWSY